MGERGGKRSGRGKERGKNEKEERGSVKEKGRE